MTLEYLRPYIDGRVVHDLGCGSFRHAATLVDLGATKVIGIDREPRLTTRSRLNPKVEFQQKLFRDVAEDIDTAWVSWPINHECGLHPLVQRAKTVIYIGKNTDGTMCGEKHLWATLVPRPVLLHVPTQKEVLIVYGSGCIERGLLPEEYAALHVETMWSYGELYGRHSDPKDLRVTPSRVG